MTTGSDRDYPVDEVARAWLTKMRGEDARTLRAEFDAWLTASPDHREAYDRLAQRMDASALLKASARHGTAHAEKRRGARLPGWLSWGAAATATALLLLAYGAGGALLPGPLSGGLSTARAAEPLVTRRGEIRSFRLADGAMATLDTDSHLEVSSTDGRRQVRLVQGRVRLVLPRYAGPYRVEAGSGAMTASGAELDLGIAEDGQVSVALLRGDARFVETEDSSGAAAALPLGATLTYRDRSAPRPVTDAGKYMPRDWPSGWAEYRKISLGHLVVEANRYAVRPIVIDEPAVAGLLVSGRFKISDTEAFADRVARLFDLAVIKRQDGLHLRKR